MGRNGCEQEPCDCVLLLDTYKHCGLVLIVYCVTFSQVQEEYKEVLHSSSDELHPRLLLHLKATHQLKIWSKVGIHQQA